MGGDSVARLVGEGRRVFLDAEHFFDGSGADASYALEVLRVAAEAGASVLVLCDTNGGMLPNQLQDIVGAVVADGLRVGIHAHNDTACAVANSLAAIGVGATHVQGTANGYGERCGNADLFSVVAALENKLDRRVLPPGRLAELGRVAHAVAEVANIAPETPPNVAPMPNASNFRLRVVMPIALPATSAARIAIHARPIRLFSTREQMTMAIRTITRRRQE